MNPYFDKDGPQTAAEWEQVKRMPIEQWTARGLVLLVLAGLLYAASRRF